MRAPGPRQDDTAVSQLTLLDAEEEERVREEEKLTVSSLAVVGGRMPSGANNKRGGGRGGPTKGQGVMPIRFLYYHKTHDKD